VASKPTTERNGITIRIPIQKQDIIACHVAAAKYLPWFPLGIDVFHMDRAYTKPVPVIQGAVSMIAQGEIDRYGYGRSGNVTVLMGNVPYLLDRMRVGEILALAKLPRTSGEFFSTNNVYLTLPVGSVQIVPSRDDLMYTDKTMATLANTFATCVAEVKAYVTTELANATTEWECVQESHEFQEGEWYS
jgi:hypothetical protein